MSEFSFNFVELIQGFAALAGAHGPAYAMWYVFSHGGWVVFGIVFVFGFFWMYMEHIQSKYEARIKWVLLAIDVPAENLQSVRAVEHIFSALWPYRESINLVEKYVDGKCQQAFSLEIVSIGGYTQFLIRTPRNYKDLVESAVYAQYPKAEIFEVEDYATRYKNLRFPSEEYDLWGSEFWLKKPSSYPIRTYPAFEHTLTQTFADPMSSLLEVFNKINKDEELWMQLVITPIADDWKEEGYRIINKIIGAKTEEKRGLIGVILAPFYYFFTFLEEMFIYGIGYEPGKVAEARAKDQGAPNKMLYLTPEEKHVIEGITMKISKIGWQTKLRALAIAKKGKLNKPKVAASFIGALQQFSTLDLNAFSPIMKTFTKANYFFVERRVQGKQNRILRNFRNRSQSAGWSNGFVMNIEELASVFHFPIPEAMKESLKRVAAKKEAAPVDLPDTVYEEEQVLHNLEMEQNMILEEENTARFKREKNDESTKIEPPGNLPI